MGLFKKKEEIPTIPTAPSLPSLPSLEVTTKEPVKKDLPELPSFPANPKNENLNQEIVKSAVSDIPPHEEEEAHIKIPESIHVEKMPEEKLLLSSKPELESSIPNPPKTITPINPQGIESQKLEVPAIPTIPKTPTISKLPEVSPIPIAPIQDSHPQAQSENKNEPIFVRIDKFQSAQKNFDEIKSKITEIESVLQKLKDVKSQEDEELKGWAKDTEKLKSRLTEIDNDLFSQL
jgi:hypothetical protein